MELTEEQKEYDVEALKETIEQCRQNKVDYNKIVHDPDSTKEDVILFMERVNMENERIRKLKAIIEARI